MSTSQQGARQAAVRAATGTLWNYEGDWLALFDAQGIPAGAFNERLLNWLNLQLASTYGEINGAMQAFAVNAGALNWSELGSFTILNFLRMEDGSFVLLEDGSHVVLES